MHRRAGPLALTALVAAALLAGCAAAPAGAPQDTPEAPAGCGGDPTAVPGPGGVLVDARITPVPRANITLRPGDHRATSGADGTFSFDCLPQGTYIAEAELAGETIATGTWTLPAADGQQDGLRLVARTEAAAPEPYQSVQKFSGFLQCAHEALIISGSCDTLVAYVNDAVEPSAGRPLPEPLEAANAFPFQVQPDWATLVLDVSFDPEAHPGIAGMRAVLRGANASDDLNSYEQYGRWHGAGPFTVRIDPNGTFPDQQAPLLAIQDTFELELLPHSHAYHSVCDPEGTTCFLGAGAAVDVPFEAVVTAFYAAPAPDGYTTLA